MDFLKRNQDAFTGGALAVVLGLMGKWMFKKQIIPSATAGQALTSFLVVSAAGIGANELKSKYEIK